MPKNGKKYDLRKRRSYRSRFADKKINTAIEKKIKAIAVREDNKNIQWFYKPKLVVNYNAAPWMIASTPDTWASINGKPLPQHMAQLGSEADPYALCLTEIGGNLRNMNGISNNLTNKYLVKRVEAHITLRNETNITKKVGLVIFSMKNVMPSTNTSPLVFNQDNIYQNVPNINNKYAGMFKALKHSRAIGGAVADVASKQYTIHATKVVTLRPSGPSNGGRVSNSNAQESTAYFEKDVHLSKTWKVGKKVEYQYNSASDQPCTDSNIFLAICSNGQDGDTTGVRGYGVAGIKYRLLQPIGEGANAYTQLLQNNE